MKRNWIIVFFAALVVMGVAIFILNSKYSTLDMADAPTTPAEGATKPTPPQDVIPPSLPVAAEPRPTAPAREAVQSGSCTAARQTPNWGEELYYSKEIQIYRSHWLEFCNGTPGRPTLGSLYQEAQILFEDMNRYLLGISSSFEPDPKSADKGRHNFVIHVETHYGAFVPAAGIGWVAEGTILQVHPKFSDFSENAEYGDEDDRLFFQRPPPIEMIAMTWDYGGCVNFDADWLSILQREDRLRSEIKYPFLRNQLLEFSQRMSEVIAPNSAWHDVCVCNEKEKFVPAMTKIWSYVKDKPDHANLTAVLERIFAETKAGLIEIKSEAEKHCSGG